MPTAPGARSVHRHKALTKMRVRIQTGTIYDLLYYLWDECLWNAWYADTSREDVDMVISGDLSLELAPAGIIRFLCHLREERE